VRPTTHWPRRSFSLRLLLSCSARAVAPPGPLLPPPSRRLRPDSPVHHRFPAGAEPLSARRRPRLQPARARGAAGGARRGCPPGPILCWSKASSRPPCPQGRCRGAAAGCADAAAARSAEQLAVDGLKLQHHPNPATGRRRAGSPADQVQNPGHVNTTPSGPISRGWRSRVLPLRRACRLPFAAAQVPADRSPRWARMQGGPVHRGGSESLIAAVRCGAQACQPLERPQQV